jgi:hypothetical protein
MKSEGRLLIGSFSVASNITGIPVDDVAVTVLMHKYGGLSFWDYSAAGKPSLSQRTREVQDLNSIFFLNFSTPCSNLNESDRS